MSTHESLDVTPATPSPAPRSFGSVLQFARPARGKKSQSDLRKAPSNASMKMQVAKVSNAESELDSDEVLSRSVSPTPSALSVGNTSQFQLPNALPREDGLDLASEALQKLMEDAHSGSFAAGALGQKLLDQQEHMRQLMQQLEEVSEREGENRAALDGTSEQASSPAALLLLEQIHGDITRMKGEQEDLMRELLHASNTNMGAVGLSATSKAEAEAIIHSYGGMPESTSYNSISATPTKPASSNARELRRQRNAAAPNLNKDEVLVNDIQQQLINELRRLQALVAERDKALAAMTDAVEEAARYKAIQEANIKKLETEKDAKDASLYEAERKEAIVREENEDVVRQLKKHENEVRLLRRQLGEKTDAAETLKVSNEDLEQKVADMLGNLATLRAKGAADQLAINGLKAQVGDLELKQRQAASKIPPSSSNLSSTASYDHSSVDSNHAGNETIAPDGPAGKRGKGHDQALTPSASLDESLANRLRTSDAVRGMETEVAKWKGAALKYRKKWAEERKHTGGDLRAREHDYDDSTDEDEDVWMDEAAKAGDVRKRSISTKSRIVSDSSSRKSSKTMGDAFGIQRHSKRSSMTWEDEEADMLDRSFGGDDDASSNAASSTRGSIDGFDLNFADPTIRSGADAKGGAGSFKRRSTYTPANVHGAKGSPLARQLQLQGDSDDESNMSNDRPSSVIYQPGALGDELAGLQGDEGEREGGQAEDSLMEDHQAAMEAALAERESAHEAALAEREKTHQIMLSQSIETHESALRDREAAHQDAVKLKDDAHQSQLAAIHKEHADSLAQHTQMHTKAVALLHEKHGQALAGREEQLEAAVAEAEKRHEERLKEAGTRQAKQHDEAMAVARERHAQVLSTAREEAQADMVSVQMEHRRLLEEREAAHAEGLERLKATHSRAIMEKEQEHRDHIGDIETSNEEYHRMRDDAFGKMLTKQEDLIRAKDGEITTLQARLSALETELKELRQKVQASELDGSSHTQALQEVQDQLRVAKEERTVAESRLAVLTESSAAREAMLDNDDEFQDAEDASQSHGGEREDPRISSDMARRDTSSTHDTISVATPANEMDVAVQTKDAGESREERAAQTDDDMWTRHQHDQLTTATRPPSSMLELEDGTTNAGAGGIVILGGDQAFRMNNNFTPSEQRPRDSISTFGGNRNGTSNRTESPAPTMYTVGAFTGRGAASDWSRRPSIDSTVSAKAAGTNAEGEEILRVPDRSKPPTMQVPPPPSMPPPPSVPAKQNVAAAIPSVVTHHSGVSQGSVEELELEDTSTPKAPNKLRVPPDTSSRPSSRVSGPPPSAFPAGRNSVGKAGRVRTTSTGSRARRETDAASIVSRTSARRTHASVRAPSAQSFASDVTSEFSRMSGVSSRASDYADGGQQRTMIVGPGGQAVSTDPLVLSSITQTMIGDYLYKYTRRSMGRAGHSDRRHKRYFWVHPYTRTLYWTLQAPSEAVAAEAINKSAFIQDVLLVEDSNNSPPGLYHMSILIMTQAREVKITAPTREKHELWITALSYLVNRDGGSTPAVEKAPSEWRQSISRAGGAGGNARRRSQTSGPGSASVSKRPSMLSPARSFASMSRKNASVDDMDRDQTPRARGYSVSQASTAQRKDTAAKNYLEELEALKTFSGRPSSTRVTAANGGASVAGGRPPSRSLAHEMFGQESRDPRTMTAEEMLEEDNENSDFDGLDNVRACCNGKHDVGVLAHRSHTHTHTANRAKSSTTSVATGSLRGSRRASKAPEDKPLKLSSAAPQLGPLSLNTMHSSKTAAEGQAKTSTSTQASSDWFSANEYSGRMTPQSMTYQPGSQPSSPKAPSYTDRVAQIRKAKQPWLR